MALLDVRAVSKAYGGVRAVVDVSFSLREGEVLALIGPNGAGKTTLFNCLTGFARPDSGEVHFAGRRIDRLAPFQVARRGLVRTFQSIRMFSGLTVYESLLVAPCGNAGWTLSRRPARRRAEELVSRLNLGAVANRACTELPLLAQRKIEVARALMVEPRAVLLDEPTAGATVGERQELTELIGELRSSGVTLMVIEHNVPFVMDVSDTVVVLDFGKVVAAGTPLQVAENPVVQEIYLGV
jgi:branched-chain amino acid transport system ATP-binding protein